MTPKTTSINTNVRPLPCFIEEIGKLCKHRENSQLNDLQPLLATAYQSLLALHECADQLPDLSGQRWFLLPLFTSASERTLEQLEIAKNDLILLSAKSNEHGDPSDLVAFTVGFIKFARQAKASPAMFQQPYVLEFPICHSQPTEEAENAPLGEPSLDWFSDGIV